MAKFTSEEKSLFNAFVTAHKAVPVGVDVAKSVFQVCYREPGTYLLKNFQLTRENFLDFVQNTRINGMPLLFGIEACGACNFWSNYMVAAGHKCRILPVNKIKIFIGRDKTDRIDAQGIYQCLLSSGQTVKAKELLPAAISSMLSIRALYIKELKQSQCAARAMLYEQGVVCNTGIKAVKDNLSSFKDQHAGSEHSELYTVMHEVLSDNMKELEKNLEAIDAFSRKFASSNDLCRRLMTIPGIGLQSAVAMYPALYKPEDFPSSRHFAAYAGVAPAVTGTGGDTRVLGTRKGNTHIKTALYMAALVRYSKLKKESAPIIKEAESKGKAAKVMILAIANRMARVAWAIAKNGTEYDAAKCSYIG